MTTMMQLCTFSLLASEYSEPQYSGIEITFQAEFYRRRQQREDVE